MSHYIVGIDAAIANTGFAFLTYDPGDENIRLSHYGNIETEREARFPEGFDLNRRMAFIRYRLRNAFATINSKDERPLNPKHLVAVVEYTDWGAGLENTRSAHARDTKARWYLGLAYATVFGICQEENVPMVGIGVKEWRKQFNARDDDSVATQVARIYSQAFSFEVEATKRRKLKKSEPGMGFCHVLRDRDSRKVVPSHIANAIGIAYVGAQHYKSGNGRLYQFI